MCGGAIQATQRACCRVSSASTGMSSRSSPMPRRSDSSSTRSAAGQRPSGNRRSSASTPVKAARAWLPDSPEAGGMPTPGPSPARSSRSCLPWETSSRGASPAGRPGRVRPSMSVARQRPSFSRERSSRAAGRTGAGWPDACALFSVGACAAGACSSWSTGVSLRWVPFMCVVLCMCTVLYVRTVSSQPFAALSREGLRLPAPCSLRAGAGEGACGGVRGTFPGRVGRPR